MRIQASTIHGSGPTRFGGVPTRSGGVMVEFALISFALYLLLAAILGFGRWMAVQQAAQEAARVAAREIALYPLPAGFDFNDALTDAGFRGAVYSEDHLVVDLATNPPGAALENRFAAMPVVNRALRPLMITSIADVAGARRNLLHVPGALIDSATSPSGLTVRVPRILDRDPATGIETSIELAPFLEEVGPGSFSLASPDRGLVTVRLNVAYQSATLSAYVPSNGMTLAVEAQDPGGGGAAILGPGPDGTGPYSGTYGLGTHLALDKRVRPFRRLIAAQALFRREVFL